MPLSRRDRAIADRFSYGATPALLRDVRRAGGGRQWLDNQIQHQRLADRRRTKVTGWFPSLRRSPYELLQRDRNGTERWWEVMQDLSRRTTLLRAESSRQTLEVMTDFWSNLLHVPLFDNEAAFHRPAYEAMIRGLAFTSFDRILRAAITHPAMGLYLDNAVSTGDAPNENLGRELLEIHTVGRIYSERDVKNSARILTGYTVDKDYARPYYNPDIHYRGRVRVLGFSHANRKADGRKVTRAYLSYLAHHPATARRIAERLCVRFVGDRPTPELVDAVTRAYRRHGTAVVPTLRALVSHPDFLQGERVRAPGEEYVATVRRLGIKIGAPVSDSSFAKVVTNHTEWIGQRPYDWPAPNGFPEPAAAWATVGRVLASAEIHRALGHGWWPVERATYRTAKDWLPESAYPITAGRAVNKIAKKMFGHPVPRSTRKAAARAVGLTPSTVLDASSAWDNRVLGMVVALLDSPSHQVR